MPEEDLLDGLARNHGRQLGGDVEAVPDATEVVEVDIRGVGSGIELQGVLREAVRDMIARDGAFVQGD